MQKYAILIDAGFLKRKLGSREKPALAADVVAFSDAIRKHHVLADKQLHRIYYYDAEPLVQKKLKPLTGGKQHGVFFDFGATELATANRQMLDSLKKEPFFSVRLGEVSFRGWSVKHQKIDPNGTALQVEIKSQDIIPNIQQKGVDMRIGLDIASLSLKDHVDVIVLISGDSDFIPALKFARREGKQVYVFTLEHSVKHDLYEHSDVLIAETFEQMNGEKEDTAAAQV